MQLSQLPASCQSSVLCCGAVVRCACSNALQPATAAAYVPIIRLCHALHYALQASIISIAKRSAVVASSSADGHTVVTITDGADDEEVPWHAVETAEEVVEELVSSSTAGLTAAEAARRLVAHACRLWLAVHVHSYTNRP